MVRDRPGGDASTPGDLPSEFGEETATQQGRRVSPSHQPPTISSNVAPDQRRRFEGSFPGAPGRSGAALDRPQRGRHGLEVVHVAERGDPTRPDQSDPTPEDDIAARMMREIEEAVVELRRQFAGRLISLQRPNEPPVQDSQHARSWRSGARIAAIGIALGLALGAALRLRK